MSSNDHRADLGRFASNFIRALAKADAALDPAAISELAPTNRKNASSRHEGGPRNRGGMNSDPAQQSSRHR